MNKLKADCRELGKECDKAGINYVNLFNRSPLHDIAQGVVDRRMALMRQDTHKQLAALAIAEAEAAKIINPANKTIEV